MSLCNNFECSRNVQGAGQHSLLHPLQDITRSRTKDLIHLDIQLLGPSPQYVHDDVQLYDLVAWVLSGKLPPQWLVLLCLLSVLPRAIFQPRHILHILHMVLIWSDVTGLIGRVNSGWQELFIKLQYASNSIRRSARPPVQPAKTATFT